MFRNHIYILMLCMLALPSFAEDHSSNDSGKAREILRFDTMYAVDEPFLSHEQAQSSDPKIRNILGDYSPWKIGKSTKGTLSADGTLMVKVRGLVFTDAPNDEENFRALVSCLTFENNLIVEKNITTDPFPTGGPHNNPNLIGKGNANIKAHLTLPRPCVAPIVMILNGNKDDGDLWFAVTGY
jgi:hypothetical protein